jgi:hypothetical protein
MTTKWYLSTLVPLGVAAFLTCAVAGAPSRTETTKLETSPEIEAGNPAYSQGQIAETFWCRVDTRSPRAVLGSLLGIGRR